MGVLKQQGVQVSLLVSVLTLTTGVSAMVMSRNSLGRSVQADITTQVSAIAADRASRPIVRASEPITDGGIARMVLPVNVNDDPKIAKPTFPVVLGSFGIDDAGVTAKAVIKKDANGRDYIGWGFLLQGVPPKR